MRIRRLPRFADDLVDAHVYLAAESPRSAARLLGEIERLATLLALFPEVGRRRDRLGKGIRSFRVRRFRYLVFYRIEDDSVVLLRALHASRRITRKLMGG